MERLPPLALRCRRGFPFRASPQRVGDLLFGELGALHRSLPFLDRGPPKPSYSSLGLPDFSGETSCIP
jgi:hypothetical protein